MTEEELTVVEDIHAILERMLLLSYRLNSRTTTEDGPANKELLNSTHDYLTDIRTKLFEIRGRQGLRDNTLPNGYSVEEGPVRGEG